MNILTLVILAVILLFAFLGMKKGMVRKLGGIAALIAASLLVSAFLPYITEIIRTRTPVYTFIRDRCEEIVTVQVAKYAGFDQSGGVNRDQIKSLMEQYGMDSSQVDYMSDEEIQSLIDQYFPGYGSFDPDSSGSGAGMLSSMTTVEQTKLIQNLPIPSFMKDAMLNYNNSEGYRKLDVTDFGGYISGFFANVIVNVVSFLVTLLIVWLILGGILNALDLFARLPVLSTVNRVGGLVLGAAEGLFFVWIFFLLLSLLSATPIGLTLLNMVNESPILRFLYDKDLFLKVVTDAVSGIM